MLASCGAAVLPAKLPEGGIGLVGVSFAFGFAVLTAAYTIGFISGAHLNPGGFGRTVGGEALSGYHYIICSSGWSNDWRRRGLPIASGNAGFDVSNGFAANGYGAHSLGGYTLMAALITEVVMTFMFVMVVLGATDKRAPLEVVPIAISFALTLIHLISIPVTNTSVDPARSLGQRSLSATGRWRSFGYSGWRQWSEPSLRASFIRC